MVNNTVVAVCGHYVCNYHGHIADSGELVTQGTWCNNRVQCYNGGVDEKYCSVEEEKFQCRYSSGSVRSEISTFRACDRKCDCFYCDDEWNCNVYNYHYWYKCNNSSEYIPSHLICNSYASCYHGDDESNCGNVTTCIWEGYSTVTYMLTNYSRCTPWVMCTNKLDQINCSDTTLAPLQCPVGGYMSTVSKHIICKSIVYAAGNIHHSNTSAICDVVWMCSVSHQHLVVTYTNTSSVIRSLIVMVVLMRKVHFVAVLLQKVVKENTTTTNH